MFRSPESNHRFNQPRSAELADDIFLKHLAGYLDCSMSFSIEMSPTPRGNHSYVLRLDLERANPTIIQTMRHLFPAYSSERLTPQGIHISRWYAKARVAQSVLEALGDHLCIKKPQLSLAREFIQATGSRTEEESRAFQQQMHFINQNPSFDKEIQLTFPYIAGVFDAHGALEFRTLKPETGHSQPHTILQTHITINNREFMEKLGQYFNTPITLVRSRGIIVGYRVAFTGQKAKDFLNTLLPFLRIKRGLAQLAIAFQEIRTPPLERSKLAERKIKEEEILRQVRQLLITHPEIRR